MLFTINNNWRNRMKRTIKQRVKTILGQSTEEVILNSAKLQPKPEPPPELAKPKISATGKVTGAIAALRNEAEQVAKAVTELDIRLKPICTPTPPEQEVVQTPVMDVPVADGLAGITQILLRVNTKLASLNQRLEL